MFSLISCAALAGIAEWVCCPGRLNAPLYRALAACPVVHRWDAADNAAAAFFALGRAQATGRPVAVVAGSGHEAAAMLPAAVNAYYGRHPLLIITVDNAANGGGTGAPATIEQESLFGIYAPTARLELPCPISDLPDLAAQLAEGFPVHLQLRVDADAVMPMRDFSALTIADPPAPPPFRGSLVALSQMLRFHAQDGLVLMIGALEPAEQEPALWLARTLRVPVVADAASGLREELAAYSLQGAEDILVENQPRYILRIGAVPESPFWPMLEDMPNIEVFSISRSGFSGLSRRSEVIEGEPEQIMKALGDVPHVGDTMRLLPASRQLAGRTEELLMASPESAPALVRAFSNHAALADSVCLGSPSAAELWNKYAQWQAPTLYLRNLHTMGSQGILSTFLGLSADTDYACCLVGDLAVLRDMAAPSLLHQLAPGRRVIAVLANDGAASSVEETEDDPELHRLLCQPPTFRLSDLAALWGAEYYPIHSESDLEILDSAEDDALIFLELLPE